ncbi:MAG: hypothetical protein OHK0013_01630 [Sandaracinaceae bacterium]
MTAYDPELRERVDDIQAEFADRFRRRESIDLDWFLARVLDVEVQRLRALDPSLGDAPPELLFLLCGMSPQPLFVSIMVQRPRQVRLVASQTEAGRRAADEIEQRLEDLRRLGRIDCRIERRVEIAASDPARGYVELRAAIRESQREHQVEDLRRVRLDITGGKKTMVAAAYLVAAELGIATTYVDSDAYDEQARQPVPCTSEIRTLEDPIGAFRLRDLDAARNDARGLDLAGAARRLREVTAALRSSRLPPPVPIEQIETAAARCDELAAWQDGRFLETTIGGSILDQLRGAWSVPPGRNRLKTFAKDDPKSLVAFAIDRLAWSKVLAPIQTMAAFLRAYSSVEVALDGLVEAQLHHRRWCPEKKLNGWRDLDKHLAAKGANVHEFLSEKLGAQYSTLRADDVRNHRNALVHGIEELDPRTSSVYLEQDHAAELLETIRRTLGVGPLPSIDEHAKAIRSSLAEVERLLTA